MEHAIWLPRLPLLQTICVYQETLDLKASRWLKDSHKRLWNDLLQEGDLGLRACESLYSLGLAADLQHRAEGGLAQARGSQGSPAQRRAVLQTLQIQQMMPKSPAARPAMTQLLQGRQMSPLPVSMCR